MLPYDGVNVLDRVAAHDTTALAGPRVLCLLVTGVDSLQGLQERDKVRRESLQGCHLGSEDGVATSLGGLEEEECGETRRLVFIADIGVPGRRDRVIALLVVEGRALVAVDEVQVWVTLRMT